MKLIKPSFEILEQEIPVKKLDMSQEQYVEVYKDYMYKHIEKCARVCYKSEHLIKEGSAITFVERMIKSGHYATLEHGTVYLKFPDFGKRYEDNPYSKIVYVGSDFIESYVTTNLRVLVENDWLSDLQYVCYPAEFQEKRITVHFISNIHFYKDLTRHRKMSYCIESTRYCNYSKDKFGNELTFIKPVWFSSDIYEGLTEPERIFWNNCEHCEYDYIRLIDAGWKPEQAAAVLIQDVKADIYCTGFVSDWNHIFELRADSHAHPTVQELMYPLKEAFKQLC